MTPSPLRLPSGRVALAASLLIGVALCFIPLTGVQGAESALGLALVLPSFVAANAASYVAAFRRSGLSEPASAVLWRTLLAGLADAGRLSPRGLEDIDAATLTRLLTRAAAAAALNCAREGCDPPTRAEIDAHLAGEG